LEFQREISDLVQKKRAVISRLKTADCLIYGSGESSFFATEELALDQRRRYSGAIQRDEAVSPARTGLMNGPCNHFLAGAVSPRIRTAESTGATRLTSSSKARNFALFPIRSEMAIVILLV
jgi:hypothetical protein